MLLILILICINICAFLREWPETGFGLTLMELMRCNNHRLWMLVPAW